MKNIYSMTLLVLMLTSSVSFAADYEASVSLSPEVELSLPVSGVVKTLKVSAGQRVSKGDELLSLDPVPFSAAKVYAQSRLTVQKTLLTASQRDLEQQKELYDRTVLATVELENAELRERRDRANLEAAKAQLSVADYRLSYSKLYAPYDAIILSVEVNQGQSINNTLHSQPLISLARQGYYLARFNVPMAELDSIRVDQPVTIKMAGKSYQGKVSSIDFRAVDGSERKGVAVAAEFIAKDEMMLVGQKASVHIE
jgi:RND family efflux transporter MFP subunit